MSSFDWGTDRTSDSAGSDSQQSGGSVPQPGGSDPAGGPPNRRGLVVGVLTALFVVALGWFVVRPMLTGTTDSAAAAPAARATSAGMSAATATPTPTATPSSSETVTETASPTVAGTGTPRNPFVPLLTAFRDAQRNSDLRGARPAVRVDPAHTHSVPVADPAHTHSVRVADPDASDRPAGQPRPPPPRRLPSSDAAEGAVSPHGTLALTAISSHGGSVSAQMTWNGSTYRAQPGEQFTKYLTLVDVSGKQARFSYRDKQFTLGLHQKRTF